MFFGVNFQAGYGQEVNSTKFLVCIFSGPHKGVIVVAKGAAAAFLVTGQRRVCITLYGGHQFFAENIPLPILIKNRFCEKSELVHGSGPF
jgi:hypothetical protein